MNGNWCSDIVESNGLKAMMPLLLDTKSKMPLDNRISQGVLGLSPKDDSSGPLFVEHLY